MLQPFYTLFPINISSGASEIDCNCNFVWLLTLQNLNYNHPLHSTKNLQMDSHDFLLFITTVFLLVRRSRYHGHTELDVWFLALQHPRFLLARIELPSQGPLPAKTTHCTSLKNRAESLQTNWVKTSKGGLDNAWFNYSLPALNTCSWQMFSNLFCQRRKHFTAAKRLLEI